MNLSFKKILATATAASLLAIFAPAIVDSPTMIDETQSQWIDREAVSAGNISSGERLAFDVTTDWQGTGGFDSPAHVYSSAQTRQTPADLFRLGSGGGSLWQAKGALGGDKSISGQNFALRESNTKVVPAVIDADDVHLNYTGNPADFSWYLARNTGTCVTNPEAYKNSDQIVLRGSSLDRIEGVNTIESINGTGNVSNGYMNRFNLCLILEANDNMTQETQETFTISVSPRPRNAASGTSWSDTIVGRATIRTSFDATDWNEERNNELMRVLESMGQMLHETPNGAAFPRERTGEMTINPLAFDRTRHNLSYCHYANGMWSVAATTAYSSYGFTNVNSVPQEYQWIYSSERGFFTPSATLGGSWSGRCDADGISVNGSTSPSGSGGTGGWLWNRGLGLVAPIGHEQIQFIIPEDEQSNQQAAPWKGDEVSISRWSGRKNADLIENMHAIGAALDRFPNGQRVSARALVNATNMTLDPRTFDRSRLNLSYCTYSNGDWSVAATTAESAMAYASGTNAVPLDQQYIYSSRDGFFRPSSPLPSSSGPRCALDGIPTSAGLMDNVWLWSRLSGMVQGGGGRDTAWVVEEFETASYWKAPWAWDIQRGVMG